MALNTAEDMSRFQQRRRLAIAGVIALILAALLTIRSAWESDWAHEYIEDIGIGIIVLSILGRMWCTLYIGGRKSSEIVRLGPYSISRNPLYVFSTTGAAGIGMMTGSLTVALALALVCYAAFYFVILAEEGYLQRIFGETYTTYKSEVPRFLPKFSIYKERELLSVRASMLYKTLADGLVFFVSYPLLEFVEYLQSIDVLPVLLRLY